MAENVGGIQYTVDADTSGIIKAETVVEKSNASMVNSFKSLDKQGTTSFKKLNTEVSGTAKAVRKARPDMQNMSYQLQDMAVQAQMGTSAFVIMAQQLPQMLVGMGAWAGAIGVAVTVLGLLATTMIDTTTDMEKLEKAEQVKAVMTVGSSGIASYSDEMKKLSNISKELLQVKLNTALAAQQNAFKLAGKAAKEAYEEATPFFNLNWDAYKNQQEAVFDNIIDDKELEKLGMAHPLMDNAMNGVYGLNDALKSIQSGNLDSGIERVTSSLELLSNSAAQNTEEGRALISSLTDIVAQYKEGKLTVDQLTSAVNGNSEAFKGNSDALQSFLQEIHLSNVNMLEGERAALRLRLQMDGLTESQITTAMAAYDYNQSLVRQKQATEDAIKADEKRKKSIDDINDSLDTYFDKEQSDDEKETESKKQKAVTYTENIIQSGKSQAELFAEEQEELLKLREEALITQEEYDAAVAASVKNRNEQIEESNASMQSQQALFTQSQGTMLDGLANMFGTFASAMEAQDKKSFDKKKKFQTAQAIINTAMAISNALAAAPPPINFVLAAAAGVAGAVQVAAIQNQQFDGAREFGGPVTNGKSYLVGERGPEIFTPNTSGGIISNKDIMGSSNNQETFNVNFNMTDTSDAAFQQQVYRNADLFVSIIRSYKSNQGESF